MAQCILCGGHETRKVFREKQYDLLSCQACELLFIDPYPESMADVHDKVVDDSYDDLEVLNAEKHHAAGARFYDSVFPQIEPELQGMSSVLDVGCGTGQLLVRIGREFPQMRRAGIELSRSRAAMAREKAGCDIMEIPIEEFRGEDRYDVVTLINVLSHIPSLDALFGAVRSMLNPGGKFIIRAGEHRSDIQKSDIFDWGIPSHLHFLGLKTIDFISKKYGFRITRHLRQPYSAYRFARSTWLQPGRSAKRNVIKKIVAYTPGALPILKALYDRRHGQRIYTSLIVLTPVEA